MKSNQDLNQRGFFYTTIHKFFNKRVIKCNKQYGRELNQWKYRDGDYSQSILVNAFRTVFTHFRTISDTLSRKS